jgi:lysophospholipase L1-like esterase
MRDGNEDVSDAPAAGERFSRRRSLLYAAILVVLFFGLLEGGLRLVGVRPPVRPRILLRAIDVDISFPFMRPDRDAFWSPRPGFRGEFLGKTVTIDALGLRGPEVALPKPAGRRRILCFGDSITFGYGVSDYETYPARLGERLANRGADVVNAGVTGYTSHQVLRLLRRLAPTVEADMATFCIGWNDGNRRPVDDLTYERRLHLSMALEGLADHLYIYRAMKVGYARLLWRDPPPSAQGTVRVPLPQYRQNLAAIVALCRSYGIRPIFIALPHRKRAADPPPPSAYANALAESARTMRVPLLDCGVLGLSAEVESNDEYFIDSLHFNVAGNQRMGDELVRQLASLGIV